MKTQTKLVLGLLLALGYVNANCDVVKAKRVPNEEILKKNEEILRIKILGVLHKKVGALEAECKIITRGPASKEIKEALKEKDKLKEFTKSVENKAVSQLTVSEKEVILTVIVENLFDAKHEDKFASHAEFITQVFDHGHTTPGYQELGKFLRKHKNCNSIFEFLSTILPELKNKAPKEITQKVIKIVDREGTANVAKVIYSKLAK